MPRTDEQLGWKRRVVVDLYGRRIGRILDVHVKPETDAPEWACITVGRLGLRRRFVPLKLAKVPPHGVYPHIVRDIVNSFEKRNLWREAQDLAELTLSMEIDDPDDVELLKINRWLCIQQQGHVGDTVADIRAWQPSDKTSEAAKAALLRDYDECARLLREALKGPRAMQRRLWFKDQPLMQRAIAEEPR